MEAKFCDFNGQVGLCGVFVGYGSDTRCQRHRNSPNKPKVTKIGKYSGMSAMRVKDGYKRK